MELTHISGKKIRVNPSQIKAVSEISDQDINMFPQNEAPGCEVLIGETILYQVKEPYKVVREYVPKIGKE